MPVFYGRYIDDMLAIVPANSADQALQYAKSWIQVGDVEIEWSVSEYNTPFLDMLVYLDPFDLTRVHHKPYAKARNHKERIPWASHHPKDVKKGTYIGEMSRLAVLSSKPEHYSDAIEQLKQLYIGRGYPLDLVRKWTNDNYSKRWVKKLTNVNNVAETPFVIKSHFSPSWSLFDVHKLGQSVVNSWLGSMASYRDAASKWNELTADARFLDLRTAINPAARSFSEAGHLGPPATAESVPDRAGLSFTGGLAQAWPLVKNFKLPCSSTSPSPLLDAWTDFVFRCPAIETLKLPTLYVSPVISTRNTYPADSRVLHTLHVSASGLLVARPEPVARFLDRAFPNLDAAQYLAKFARQYREARQHDGWRQVFAELAALQAVRCERKDVRRPRSLVRKKQSV
ncbi:hypothetical protein A0H81_01615 [Grifola frondosa]|uniref:Helix-turn-helix domain-containing protein n=1 Tax=Grifola frondosa TaxID=5627 RepID=A0A1C7MNL5_GRIFR|nr:hypothetical protein A0H81_01615 [Grifola frondosa]